MKTMTPNQAMHTVLQMTGMSEQEYCNHVYEHGLAFTENYCMQNEIAIKVLSESEGYWKWFKNEWMQTEIRFIDDYKPVANKDTTRSMKQYWLSYHKVCKMLNHPQTRALTIEIRQKMGQIVKQQNQAI